MEYYSYFHFEWALIQHSKGEVTCVNCSLKTRLHDWFKQDRNSYIYDSDLESGIMFIEKKYCISKQE